MPESLGTRLRQQRESQQIALATIAERTKIKLSLLEELENDDVSHWPTGIFRRAFVRAYAHAVGMDYESVVREFLVLYPDPIEAEAAATAEDVGAGGRTPTRLGFLIDSAVQSMSRFWSQPVPTAVAEAVDPQPVITPALEPPTRIEPVARAVDLAAVAQLCTGFARVDGVEGATALLERVAMLIEAAGLIVWVWEPSLRELKPVIAHGYPQTMVARLPSVTPDADNATAAAFRSGDVCVVRGSARSSGAIVAPMMAPVGCVGVLAIELADGREEQPSVRELAELFAAQLVRICSVPQHSMARSRMLA